MVRFPPGMRDWIAQAAGSSHRSMNAEIIARLQHSQQHWPTHIPLGRPPEAATTEDEENELLERFRRLSAARRTALLKLLG